MHFGAIRLARDALATRDLRRLQLAAALAGVGGWAFMVALAVHAYAVGGAAAVGLAALVRMAPAGLAAPLTGLAADRFPRRDVLLAAVLARAILLGLAALAVAAGAPLALLLVLATLFTVAATAHKPAQAALLPHLAPDRAHQAAANALWTAIDNGAFVAGAIAGGALVAAFGAAAAFAASGFAFAAAASALARIDRDPRASRFSRSTRESRHSPLEGMRSVARDRRLRLLVGVLSATTFVEGMIDVLVVVTALRLVDLGDAGVGWLNAAWGVGGMAGGAVALKLLAHDRLRFALPAGGLLIGLPLVLLAGLPSRVAALAALTVLGVGYALVETAGITLLQRLSRDGVRARAFAVVESSYWLTTGAGAMLAPLLIAVAGLRGALAIAGIALPVLMVTRWVALVRLATPPVTTVARAPRERRVLEPVVHGASSHARAPGATAGYRGAASTSARPGRAGARSPAAGTAARPATPAARQT
jgi:MFS family permease